MKKPVKKTVKKTKKLSRAQALAKLKANAKALARTHKSVRKNGSIRTPHAKKRTLSLNGPHVATSSWRDLLKLGRNANDASKPRLELDSYLTERFQAAPSVVDFASQVASWPVYGNDRIGDCTAACAGHQIQAWTRYTGTEADIPEADVIQLYSAVSGYDPKTGANDNGAVIQDVLTYWRKSGVPVAGHKILAFAQLKDLGKIHDALWMFGSVYLGFDCPESALQQFDAGQPWTVVPGSPIAGGHAVPVQYADLGSYQVVTWGRLQQMDQAFMSEYVSEAWVVITDDWLEKNGSTPEGLDLQALGQDLADLTGQPNPFPAPRPPQPPAPGPNANVKADLEILAADMEKLAQDL